MKKKVISISEIINVLGNELICVYGDIRGVFIDNFADKDHVTESTLDWINNNKANKQSIAELSIAKAIVADSQVVYSDNLKNDEKVLIIVQNPRRAIAIIMTELFIEKSECGIHPRAIIDPEAIIDSSATIGPGCVVGKVSIGKNTVLKPNVVLYDDVILGDNCLVQAGAVIGTDGLGCMRDQEGKLLKIPHIGGVVIGNDVEIGANCQIAKGVLSDTIIKNGCKINGMCFIAHNCVLEENVWITGDTMLCGTVHVGKNATIFSNVVIRDQRSIGDNSVIGMGSVVTRDVPNGETWVGNPAKPF